MNVINYFTNYFVNNILIIHQKDNTLVEGKDFKTWDEVPNGISSLEIATFGNELITLPKCKKYFYSVEARASMAIGGDRGDVSEPVITAYLVGGIMENDKALYIRITTRGHINIQILDELPFKESVYRTG